MIFNLDFDERVILERLSGIVDGEVIYIYDVGAAHGHWSMLLNEMLYHQQTRFHLFEANLENIAGLNKWVKSDPTWELVPCPVSGNPGMVVFEENSDNSEHSMIVVGDKPILGNRLITSAITLGSYSELSCSFPSIIKIDVEGAEVDVLSGAQGSLRLRPYIQFEYGGQWRYHDRSLINVKTFTVNNKYTVFEVSQDRVFRVADLTNNDYIMRNLLAVPDEKIDEFLNG